MIEQATQQLSVVEEAQQGTSVPERAPDTLLDEWHWRIGRH